jgi:hypothetical protein
MLGEGEVVDLSSPSHSVYESLNNSSSASSAVDGEYYSQVVPTSTEHYLASDAHDIEGEDGIGSSSPEAEFSGLEQPDMLSLSSISDTDSAVETTSILDQHDSARNYDGYRQAVQYSHSVPLNDASDAVYLRALVRLAVNINSNPDTVETILPPVETSSDSDGEPQTLLQHSDDEVEDVPMISYCSVKFYPS